MKTTVINVEDVESVLSPAGVEKKLCTHPGIHKVESNFMTGTATVYHDEVVTLDDLKRFVAECGYACSGECLPAHMSSQGNPPAAVAARTGHEPNAHAGHDMPVATPVERAGHTAPAVADAHAGHDMSTMGTATDESAKAGETAAMAHEMGHGTGLSMEGMVQDMRNRFLVSFVLAIPVFLYSPLFTDYFGIQLPVPFGLSNNVFSFLLATPAVLYGGWVFYVGAWRGLKNRVLNMAVLVSLSVLAGYLFSVAVIEQGSKGDWDK